MNTNVTTYSRVLTQIKFMGLLLLFVAAGFCLQVSAQGKWELKGDMEFDQRSYIKAIELYEWAARKDDSPRIQVKLGDCYRKLNDYPSAEATYSNAAAKGWDKENFVIHYTQMMLANNHFDQALAWVKQMSDQHPDNERIREMYLAVNSRNEILADSLRFSAEKLPFNTRASDFSPFPFGNGILFASSRKQSSAVVYSSETDRAPLVDLYFVEQIDSAKWGKPKPLAGSVNSRANDGPGCITRDGKTLFFTRNDFLQENRTLGGKGVSRLKLFQATRVDGNWESVMPLPFNSDYYAIGHPALSPKEDFLYFASDQPGGFGGTDLYRVSRTEGAWGKPENLGPAINTPGDELFPFVHSDGTLYFSSDGHIGLGNLDCFSARFQEGKWKQVRNLGYPVNSPQDDFGIAFDSTGKAGYFSSNRGKDPQNDDLYSFITKLPPFPCQPMEKNVYCYRFYEQGSMTEEELDSMPFVYEWDLGDGEKTRGLEVEHCFPGPGLYEVRLNVVDTTNGFVFLNDATYDLLIEDKKQVVISGPQIIGVGDLVKYDGTKSIPENCIIDRWFWDFGEGMVEGGPLAETRFERVGKTEIRLGVIGHHPETGEEVVRCRSFKIEVVARAEVENKRDSLQRATIPPVIPVQGEPAALVKQMAEQKFGLRELTDLEYKVQLLTSPSRIPLDSSLFDGFEDVEEYFEDPDYIYFAGAADDPKKLYPIFKKAVQKQMESAMIVAFQEGKTVSGHDSTFWNIEARQGDLRLKSLVRGVLVDESGNPVQGTVVFDDLIDHKVIAKIKTLKNGKYEIELANGAMYGFHAEADGYLSVSDYLDLRETEESTEYIGKLKLVSRKSLVESGETFRINNIFFDTDSDVLKPESLDELNRLVQLLKENPGASVAIEGHTDNVGSDEYNMDLSLRRARAVVRFLTENGFQAANLEAKGFGESRPIDTNDTEDGRANNRRVELRFLK